MRDPDAFHFLWVEDFPLFLPKEEAGHEGELESSHHPFTAPIDEHKELVYTDPSKVSKPTELCINSNIQSLLHLYENKM